MDFNLSPSYFLHLDLNSCFATIEQQANPLLRGKPLVVAAYATPNGCILAASIEAKKLGIKTGMRVKDGKKLYPRLIVLFPDPWKYRCVHLALRRLISEYTADFDPKSIDEFILNMKDSLKLKGESMHAVAREIKRRIKEEIGDWLTVSVGIAPNRFLAKVASNLHKPDGLDEINERSYVEIFKNLKLTDLCGIKSRNAVRLNIAGIYTVWDFYNASLSKLKYAFHSICGYYWYLRLHGYEIDDFESKRGSYGNSYALPRPFFTLSDLSPILTKLTEKTGARLRAAGYKARGIHLTVFYRDGTLWHQGKSLPNPIFDSRDIYKEAVRLLSSTGLTKPVRNLAVSVFGLVKENSLQLNLFSDAEKKAKLVASMDEINSRWGQFVISGARMCGTEKYVPDRIAFGGVAELTEFAQNST